MEIRIYDNAGINQTLDFDFRKIASENLYGDVLSEIKKIVRSEYEKISNLLLHSQNLKIKISLESESKKESVTKLASFDVALSSDNEFIFHIYYSSIKQLANKILKIDSAEIYSLENTILHEFIHAVDLHTLKETYLTETNNIKLTKKSGIFNITEIELSSHNNNVQWAFLNYFTTFRNEGIAILGEKLLGSNNDNFEEKDIENYLKLFRHEISCVLGEASDLHFYNEIEKHEVYEKLNEIYLSAYNYAELILLVLLETLNPNLSHKCIKAQDYILGKAKNELTNSDIHQLLKIAIDIDVSEFINGILRHPFFDKNQALISRKLLFECCAIIQDDTEVINEDGITLFAKTIGVIGYNQSASSFISAMKATIGSCMSDNEIKELYVVFTKKEYLEDIVESVKKMANILYPLAIEENNEIAKWALTYLLDDEDLIYDDISIIGWQDDWLVLNAALNIIKK
jgi:hypothetical protein